MRIPKSVLIVVIDLFSWRLYLERSQRSEHETGQLCMKLLDIDGSDVLAWVNVFVQKQQKQWDIYI